MEFETIETKRLLLIKLTPQDYKNIFANLTKEEAMEILGLQTDEDFIKAKFKSDNGYTSYNRSMLQFMLVEKSSGKVIGSCGFHNWFAEHRRAEVGYNLNSDDHKNKGYMSEALEAIIDYGFQKMDLYRMEAFIAPHNIPSVKLIHKYKFKNEGLLKKHYFYNEIFEDSLVFGLLKDEYY